MSALLVLGLAFYLLNWVSIILSTIGKQSSTPMMPLAGPVFLTLWIVLTGHSCWYIPLVWVLDVGTIFSLSFLHEMLFYTPLTRKFVLTGTQEYEKAEINFYAFGKYTMKKIRNHPDEYGFTGVHDMGTYRQETGQIHMDERHGTKRILVPTGEKQYKVEETTTDEHCRTINNWTFTVK